MKRNKIDEAVATDRALAGVLRHKVRELEVFSFCWNSSCAVLAASPILLLGQIVSAEKLVTGRTTTLTIPGDMLAQREQSPLVY